MRGNFSSKVIADDVRTKAGRFYYAYYYFFTFAKHNRHAITGR